MTDAPPLPGRGAPPLPVSVITGFLGSGKTTLLAALLRHPGMARAAVIVNEFGEVGLDHDLVEASDEQIVQLGTGCLCCATRGDLARTLAGLLARRAAGAVPPFERVVIETSGLADPAPILQGLMLDDLMAEALRLDGVVTLVDAVNGPASLERFPEAARQVAAADRLLLTKTDLAAEPEGLRQRLAALNPDAPVLSAVKGDIDPEFLGARPSPAALPFSPRDQREAGEDARAPRHTHGIGAVCLLRDEPVPAVALTLFLQALAENCGDRLLRVKGLVAVAESPERPAVIHGVRHVFSPPAWLPRWPSSDRRSRLVLIGQEVPAGWVEILFDMIAAEVRAATARMQGRTT